MMRFLKKLSALILATALVICLVPTTSVLAETVVYNAGDASEFKDAVTAIRNAGAGSYEIQLTNDISGVSPSFNTADTEVTIVGNGHTISMNADATIYVANNAVVNLGDGQSSLTLTKANDTNSPGIVYINSNNAVVNMKNGVTIKDHQGNNYFGGGVTMRGGTFNMYGGKIENCGIQGGSVCFGGGVSVNYGSVFNMYGGSIEDCYTTTSLPDSNKGLVPWGAGAGVFVGGGSTFHMYGGAIRNCRTSETGGGVFVVATTNSYNANGGFGYLDSEFIMTGGEITGNTADYYGGGIAASGYYVSAPGIVANTSGVGYPENPGVSISNAKISDNTAALCGGGLFEMAIDASRVNTVSEGVKLCNNIATGSGSDVYLANAIISLPDAATMDETYNGLPADVTGRKVGAWYGDYEDSRYVDQTSAERVIENGFASLDATSGDVAIIAAPGAGHVVSFNSPHFNSDTTPDVQSVDNGGKATLPDAAEWTEGYTVSYGGKDYKFMGWYTDTTFTEKYDFDSEVTDDVELFAMWSFTGNIDYVIIEKMYNQNSNYGTEEGISTADGILRETITYTIEPYASFNREVTKDEMPVIDPNDIIIGEGSDFTMVNLPNFNKAGYGIGDYWYKVVETVGNTAGVTYDTNEYYLHLVVTNEGGSGVGVTQATLHKNAPEADGSYINDMAEKTKGFTNEYGAGDLSVTKQISGNMADPNRLFAITVTFTAPQGKVVMGDITYTGAENGTIAGGWDTAQTVVINLKSEDTVTFTNIPDGVTYTVVEDDYSGDGYTATYENDSDDTEAEDVVNDTTGAAGSITDMSDAVIITNSKSSTIDVGVILKNAPFVLIAVGALAFGVVMFISKRKKDVAENI